MRATVKFDRNSLSETQRDVSKWATVNVEQLSTKQRKRVQKYQQAIGRYLSGGEVKNVCNTNGICRSELHRAIKRCLEIHPDGRMWGFRALIPHSHQKAYQRVSPVPAAKGDSKAGRAGALTQLFDRFPALREVVDTYFLKKLPAENVHEPRISLKSTHKRFIDACRSLGLGPSDYPLNQKYLGRAALAQYLKRLMNTRRAIAVRCGENVARNLGTGDRECLPPRALRPLQQIEFDGHRIDLVGTVLVPSPLGGFKRVAMERFWILAMMDVATRAIVGHVISLGREYNQNDVLRCAKNAVTPWQPMQLTIDGLRYPEGGCFPSDTYPDLQWAVWDEFKWDNAKAHLAEKTLDKLCTTIGCTPNPGPVADPNKRPFIERWFRTFEENGFSRLPSTTGSHPKDPRRKDPEKAARKYEISFDEIEQLASVLVAEYNNDPHSGIGNRPPLEHLGMLLLDEDVKQRIRKLPEIKRHNLQLLHFETTRTVRGDLTNSRRPYIQYESVRYTSAILARSPELVGKTLRLVVDPDDVRMVKAFLPNGAELGFLMAPGMWGWTPHTLEMRQAISKLRHQKLIRYTERDNPIHVYLKFLAERALKSKSAAREYAKTTRAIASVGSSLAPVPDLTPDEANHAEERDESAAAPERASATRIHKAMVF
jgi:putative transposase